jgi:uncharacterized protein (TIGR00369 family)
MEVPPNSDLTLGMVCVEKSVPGRCVWQMRADERFANPAGIMQGGFLAAFCDSSMGAAAVTFAGVEGRKVFSSNAEMKVSFLAPVAVGSVLVCTAAVVSGGKRVAFVECSVVAGSAGAAGSGGSGGSGEGGEGSDEATGPASERLVARASSTYLFKERD